MKQLTFILLFLVTQTFAVTPDGVQDPELSLDPEVPTLTQPMMYAQDGSAIDDEPREPATISPTEPVQEINDPAPQVMPTEDDAPQSPIQDSE